MTTNHATDSARTDPTGVFITGPTGLGKTVLARSFISGALDSRANAVVIDVAKGGVEYRDLDVTTYIDLAEAVEGLRTVQANASLAEPTVVVLEGLSSTLHRDDREGCATERDKSEVDRNNRLRDELSDRVADMFVNGASSGVFPVAVTHLVRTSPFIGRVMNASSGWAHFELTGMGKGTLHTEHNDTPFIVPLATAA